MHFVPALRLRESIICVMDRSDYVTIELKDTIVYSCLTAVNRLLKVIVYFTILATLVLMPCS